MNALGDVVESTTMPHSDGDDGDDSEVEFVGGGWRKGLLAGSSHKHGNIVEA